MAFVVLTLSTRRAATAGIGSAEVEAMLGFIVASTIVGWLGGGPPRETRQVLASASSMRNVALSLAIVTRGFPDAGMEVPMVAFCALMIAPSLISFFTLLLKRLRRKA
jgi:predicted Na+-dependent transporter